jgi:hypothetical protein
MAVHSFAWGKQELVHDSSLDDPNSHSTMCDWMAVAAEWLEPIVRRMLSKILNSQVVQNDDTADSVQDCSGEGIKAGRLWVSIGDRDHLDANPSHRPGLAIGNKRPYRYFRLACPLLNARADRPVARWRAVRWPGKALQETRERSALTLPNSRVRHLNHHRSQPV